MPETKLTILPADTEPLYYIQDTRSYCGNSVSWSCPQGHGYTCDLDKAWRVNKAQAEIICRNRDTDKMWPCEEIDKRSQRHFDMQKFNEITDSQNGAASHVCKDRD
jgi:hypothetical protein